MYVYVPYVCLAPSEARGVSAPDSLSTDLSSPLPTHHIQHRTILSGVVCEARQPLNEMLESVDSAVCKISVEGGTCSVLEQGFLAP